MSADNSFLWCFCIFGRIPAETGISSTLNVSYLIYIHFANMIGDYLNRWVYSRNARVLSHVVFWVFSLGFLTVFFSRIGSDYAFSFRFACLMLPVAMGTTYFINYSLVPKYLLARQIRKFVTYFIYTLIISLYCQIWVLALTFISIAEYNYKKLGPVAGDFIFQPIGLYTIVVLGVATKLLRLWLKAERERAALKSASLEAELKLKEAELKLLKGQIHPHFLFNTLNNLYGLALEKSDVVPASILRLSELLDFLLYRSNKPVVPLADEIKLIADYIELEKLRFEDRLSLEFKKEVSDEGHVIAPFLLFPFVENAFKHGFLQDDQLLYLSITLQEKNGRLFMEVRNSASKEKKETEHLGGVGLSNVRKRLQLLYPEKYSLDIDNDGRYFVVRLELDLKTTTHD